MKQTVSNKTEMDLRTWGNLIFEIDGNILININEFNLASKKAEIILGLEFVDTPQGSSYFLQNRDGSMFTVNVYMPEIIVKYKGTVINEIQDITEIEYKLGGL